MGRRSRITSIDGSFESGDGIAAEPMTQCRG